MTADTLARFIFPINTGSFFGTNLAAVIRIPFPRYLRRFDCMTRLFGITPACPTLSFARGSDVLEKGVSQRMMTRLPFNLYKFSIFFVSSLETATD